MSLKLTEVTSEAEFTPLMKCLFESYTNPYNGFWEIFKGSSADECTKRFAAWHHADPTSHWLYVTDPATGSVVGATQWNIHQQNPYEEPQAPFTAYWLEEGSDLRIVADQFLNNVLGGRPQRMKGPHLVISWCGTHSQHRRRGVGRLMMQWGCDKADGLGLDAFVESTEAGRPLYEAAGFILVKDLWPDAEMKNPSEGCRRTKKDLQFPMHGYFMWRPKGGVYEQGKTKFPGVAEQEDGETDLPPSK